MTQATNLQQKKARVVSGMRPTGRLHLGHLVGALGNWVPLQSQYDAAQGMGSKATIKFDQNGAFARSLGSTLTGKVTITIEALPSDPPGAFTGVISGTFNGSTVSERVAESNLDTLQLYSLMGIPR